MDNRCCILIIDSDSKSCWFLSDLLRAFGFSAECALGLGLAKTLLLKKTYHAILLDLWTDRREGDNLLSLLKEHERTDPVIMMSELADDELWVHCHKRAVDLLLKPVQADQLKHALCMAGNNKIVTQPAMPNAQIPAKSHQSAELTCS